MLHKTNVIAFTDCIVPKQHCDLYIHVLGGGGVGDGWGYLDALNSKSRNRVFFIVLKIYCDFNGFRLFESGGSRASRSTSTGPVRVRACDVCVCMCGSVCVSHLGPQGLLQVGVVGHLGVFF